MNKRLQEILKELNNKGINYEYKEKSVEEIIFENIKYKEVLDKIKEYLEELLSDTKGIINVLEYHKEAHKKELELLYDDKDIFNNILEMLVEAAVKETKMNIDDVLEDVKRIYLRDNGGNNNEKNAKMDN